MRAYFQSQIETIAFTILQIFFADTGSASLSYANNVKGCQLASKIPTCIIVEQTSL